MHSLMPKFKLISIDVWEPWLQVCIPTQRSNTPVLCKAGTSVVLKLSTVLIGNIDTVVDVVGLHALLGVMSVILGVLATEGAEVWMAHRVSPIWSGGFVSFLCISDNKSLFSPADR